MGLQGERDICSRFSDHWESMSPRREFPPRQAEDHQKQISDPTDSVHCKIAAFIAVNRELSVCALICELRSVLMC